MGYLEILAEDENSVEDLKPVVDHVRRGKTFEVMHHLSHSISILLLTFHFPTFKTKKFLETEDGLSCLIFGHKFYFYMNVEKFSDEPDACDHDHTTEKAKMKVNLLHLAIIAKQPEVSILLLSILACESGNSHQPLFQVMYTILLKSAETNIVTLFKMLEGTVDLEFKYANENHRYDKNDITLKGMNCFHLAARFSSQCLRILLLFVRYDENTF